DLRGRGIVTKVRALSNGRTIGGIPFTRGPLAHLLRGSTSERWLTRARSVPANSHRSLTGTCSRQSRPNSPNTAHPTTHPWGQGSDVVSRGMGLGVRFLVVIFTRPAAALCETHFTQGNGLKGGTFDKADGVPMLHPN